jgi:hypothetical protein
MLKGLSIRTFSCLADMHVGDRTVCLSFLPCTQPSTIEEPAQVSRIVGRESVTEIQVRDMRSVHKTGFLQCESWVRKNSWYDDRMGKKPV